MSDVEDRLARLEAQVEALTKAVEALGGRRELARAPAPDTAPDPAPAPMAAPRVTAQLLTTLVGRTCLVLGGAFLLRALTANGALPGVLGVALALAYASVWYLFADRTAERESGIFHGAAAAAIGFPALFEATARFHLVPPAVAALLLCAFGGLGLAVAARRGLQLAATGTVLAVVATALGLLVQTRAPLTFATVLFAVAMGAVAVAWWRGWSSLAWLATLPFNGTLIVLLLLAGRRDNAGLVDPALLTGLVLAAAAATAVAVAVRVLGRKVPLTAWDASALPWALLLGLEGAAFLAPWPGAALTVGSVAILLGAGAYVAAFTKLDPAERRGVFVLFTTLGLLLVIEGARLALPAATASLGWATLVPAAAALASAGRPCLRTHAAVLGLFAALGAGMAELVEGAFAGEVSELPWRPLVVAATCALGYALILRRPAEGRRPFPETALLAVVAAGAGSGLVALCQLGLGAAATPAILAVARTAVLAGAAMLLAALSRRGARRDLVWVAAACLVLGGVKLGLQDLPTAPAAALVASFVLYGVALLVAPRLLKR